MSLDDLCIVEGRNEGLALILTRLHSGGIGLIERIACQNHLDKLATEHLHLIDLLLGRCDRHKNLTLDAQSVARQGYSLSVVSCAGAHYAASGLLRRERTNHIVCSANLVRAYHLQILALELYICSVTLRQVAILHQRRGR